MENWACLSICEIVANRGSGPGTTYSTEQVSSKVI